MVSAYRDYDVLECSLMWNMAEARKTLIASHPTTADMTLFLFEHDLRRMRDEVQDSSIIVIYGLGPTNPFELSTRKSYRIINFRVEFKNLKHREHVHVINALKEQFKPGLSYRVWNPNGSENIADYTEITPGWIQDLRDGNGYNGNDGRYILPFSLDVRFPRVIN